MAKTFDTELDLREQTSATSPVAGQLRLFTKTDDRIYQKNSAGVESQIAKNVYIQQTDPTMTSPGMWWQTDVSSNLVTLWIETG